MISANGPSVRIDLENIFFLKEMGDKVADELDGVFEEIHDQLFELK